MEHRVHWYNFVHPADAACVIKTTPLPRQHDVTPWLLRNNDVIILYIHRVVMTVEKQRVPFHLLATILIWFMKIDFCGWLYQPISPAAKHRW